jgi:hypothetical protein
MSEMKSSFLFTLLGLVAFVSGCKTEKNYITNGPEDWQPPEVIWRALPDAEVRGTVGLDVSVTDSSSIPKVKLYVDGAERDSLTSSPYRFSLNTESLADGVHLCEARAWDQYGNLGISPVLRVNVMNSIAQGPRLIWVPDSFASIQAAINAATDYDTIRVRDGTYYETLNLFGKGIWIESENGPTRCTVSDSGAYDVFVIPPTNNPATIRGFRMTGTGYLVSIFVGAYVDLSNNIVSSDSADGLVIASTCSGAILNNLFDGGLSAVQLGTFWGSFENNILIRAHDFALSNAASLRNPVVYGYNLFWANASNYNERFQPAMTDVFSDPLLDLTNGRLRSGSPAIDSGNPDIQDNNGSRSDIGPFGGPWAYP